MVYIIGKTFPNQAQIQGRIDSKAFDGVEMFVMDDIVENPQKYQDMVKLARDNFPIVNFETFYAVNVNGSKEVYGLIDESSSVRDRSRALFEAAIRLNDGKGNVNTHFVGNQVVVKAEGVNRNEMSVTEQVQRHGEYLKPFASDITLENTITFNQDPGNGRPAAESTYLYNGDGDIDTYRMMFEQFGIPMTLDTAHLAINLEHYRRFIERENNARTFYLDHPASMGHLLFSGKKAYLNLSDTQRELGTKAEKERESKHGLTSLWISEVSKLPMGAIKNVHFINGRVDNNDDYKDGYVDFSARDGRLLNLSSAFGMLLNRTDTPNQIVTEAVEGLYATPEAPADYNKVPYMVKLAKEINLILTKYAHDEAKHLASSGFKE